MTKSTITLNFILMMKQIFFFRVSKNFSFHLIIFFFRVSKKLSLNLIISKSQFWLRCRRLKNLENGGSWEVSILEHSGPLLMSRAGSWWRLTQRRRGRSATTDRPLMWRDARACRGDYWVEEQGGQYRTLHTTQTHNRSSFTHALN